MRPRAYRLALGAIGTFARIVKLRRPVIFCFHSVNQLTDDGATGDAMAVGVDYLEDLILDLRRRGVPILSLADACAKIENGDADPFVVLTFDDGYRDNYETLFPLMTRLKVPFTIFVTTGLVDRSIPMWWDAVEGAPGLLARDDAAAAPSLTEEFRVRNPAQQRALLASLAEESEKIDEQAAYDRALTWPMLRKMSASGLLTVGAHTEHHPVLSRLSRSEVRSELERSRERLQEEIGIAVDYMAYPYGQPWEVGTDAPELAKEVGYRAAFSTVGRPVSRDDRARPFDLPRILLSSKAQRTSIAHAYMSGLPWVLNRLVRRDIKPLEEAL